MNSKVQRDTYSLVDSGNGRKLERFGDYVIARPSAQAVWAPQLTEDAWKKAHASFTREGIGGWSQKEPLKDSWIVRASNILFKLSTTDFGHLGIFPEQRPFWLWIQEKVKEGNAFFKKPPEVLNLFAYSGGSTLAAALAGGSVCHLDASKGMVAWARENAALNGLKEAPIRWIVDDAVKFLERELKRGRKYDAIIMDPPTFGRGAKGELFKIEEHLPYLLKMCRKLLSENPLFFMLSCHTPGFSPIVLSNLLKQYLNFNEGSIDMGEMVLNGDGDNFALPSGSYARWS